MALGEQSVSHDGINRAAEGSPTKLLEALERSQYSTAPEPCSFFSQECIVKIVHEGRDMTPSESNGIFVRSFSFTTPNSPSSTTPNSEDCPCYSQQCSPSPVLLLLLPTVPIENILLAGEPWRCQSRWQLRANEHGREIDFGSSSGRSA